MKNQKDMMFFWFFCYASNIYFTRYCFCGVKVRLLRKMKANIFYRGINLDYP